MRVVTHTEPINQAVIITVEVPMLSRSLTFRTDWTATRRAAYRWTLHDLDPGSTIDIEVAGRTESAIADESGTAVFEWDGMDAEGERPGPCIAVATVDGEQRRARLGRWDPVTIGLGGLMLSGYDYLDPAARRIYTATGRLKGKIAVADIDDGYETTHSNGRYRVRFDTAGFLTEVVDTASRSAIATYRRDERGLVSLTSGRMAIDVTRSDGLVTIARDGWPLRLESDDLGRVTELVDPSGRPVRFDYDQAGRLGMLTDASGFRHRYDYDDAGRLVGITNPGRGRVDLVRKPTEHGHRVTLVTAEGRESFYQVERMPDGTKVRTSQCCGRRPAVTRINDDAIEAELPDGTRVVSQKSTGERKVILPSGTTRTHTTRKGRITVNGETYELTSDASRSMSRSPLGREFKVEEDDGRVRITRPGGTLDMIRDDQGRVTRIVDGEASLEVEYGSNALVAAAKWSGGRTSHFDYDRSGWLTAQHFSTERAVRFERDGAGLVTAVRPPGSEPTVFELNAPRVPASVRFPSEQDVEDRIDLEYDGDGLVVSRRVSELPPVTYKRGAGGAIEAIRSGDSATTFEYENGLLVKGRTDDGQITSFGYDGPFLASISHEGKVSGSIAYAYDEGFRVSRISSGGLSADIRYDADGDVSQVGEATIERDDAGRIVSITAGVVTQTYDYNEVGLLVQMAVTVGGNELWSAAYTYDRSRRIASITDSSVVTEFSYDEAGRLAATTGGFQATYDPNGNPIRVHRDDNGVDASTAPGDRLVTFGSVGVSYGPGGGVHAIDDMALTRDVLGRLVSVTKEERKTTLHRSCLGDVVGIERDDGSMVGFVCGPDGRPDAVLRSDSTTQAILVGRSRSTTPLLAVEKDRTLFIASDHVGSVRLVIDTASGEVAATRHYDVWGRLVRDEGSSSVPYGFGGGIDDPANSLVHFPARSYSPELMRWLSRDPELYLGGSTNLFAYCNADPVNYRDPTGTVPELCRQATSMTIAREPVFEDTEHWWYRDENIEAGMVRGSNTLPKVGVGDHTGRSAEKGVQCDPIKNVDQDCVERELATPHVAPDGFHYGRSLGMYGPGNTCQNLMVDVLTKCSGGNYEIETQNPDAYDHWYNPDVNVQPYSPAPDYTPDPGYTPADGGELWQ